MPINTRIPTAKQMQRRQHILILTSFERFFMPTEAFTRESARCLVSSRSQPRFMVSSRSSITTCLVSSSCCLSWPIFERFDGSSFQAVTNWSTLTVYCLNVVSEVDDWKGQQSSTVLFYEPFMSGAWQSYLPSMLISIQFLNCSKNYQHSCLSTSFEYTIAAVTESQLW